MFEKVISCLGCNCEETCGEANRFLKSGCLAEKELIEEGYRREIKFTPFSLLCCTPSNSKLQTRIIHWDTRLVIHEHA